MEFRSIHTIETAENVHLKVELAGLASRVFALGIDLMVMFTLMGMAMALFTVLAYVQAAPELGKTGTPLAVFIIFFGFNLFQEWLWNGKTVGKSIFHIRVVRDNGQPIGFWEAFGRNLLRVLDVYASGIGLLCMLFNRREKRFGDFVAGTIVINDQPVYQPGRYGREGAGMDAVASDTGSADAEPQTAPRLTAEEAELLRAYRQRREDFFRDSHTELKEAFCQYFSERWHQPEPLTTDEALDAALETYERSRQPKHP